MSNNKPPRLYLPEKPAQRWVKQKPACHVVELPAEISIDKAPPPNKTKQQAAQAQAVQVKAQAKAQTKPGDTFLAVVKGIHDAHAWLTAKPGPTPSGAALAPVPATIASAAKPVKPLELLDIQDIPDILERNNFTLSAQLMRQWFANDAYAVGNWDEKNNIGVDVNFYPAHLVDTKTLKHANLLKYPRFKAAYEKIKSQEFLQSQAVKDAIYQIFSKVSGSGQDIIPQTECQGDPRKIHSKYVIGSVNVGSAFTQQLGDIRSQDIDKSSAATDDMELALGDFKLYAVVKEAVMLYQSRSQRKIRVDHIEIYAMVPYCFDDFDETEQYKGHWNKKHFGVVLQGNEWSSQSICQGNDVYAKHAVYRPLTNERFRAWRQKHNQGGDMLLFSERVEPRIQPIDVLLPMEQSPSGTLYLGGAGLDGPYIKPTVAAFKKAGINNIYVDRETTENSRMKKGGTLLDAWRAGLVLRYEDAGEWPLAWGMNRGYGQFNLIGYSYGSVLAAQTANYYANKGAIIDNLVLIASPIGVDFLAKLRSHKNIKNIVIYDLTEYGDAIYAGISQIELMNPALATKIGADMLAGKGEGHFYFAHDIPELEQRLNKLATHLYSKGLR